MPVISIILKHSSEFCKSFLRAFDFGSSQPRRKGPIIAADSIEMPGISKDTRKNREGSLCTERKSCCVFLRFRLYLGQKGGEADAGYPGDPAAADAGF